MLQRRLAFFALLLPTISLAHAPRRMDSGVIVLQQGLSIIAPAVLLLAAAWLCGRKVRLALALALALALTLIPTLTPNPDPHQVAPRVDAPRARRP